MDELKAAALRAPFPPELIGKLPRVTQKDGTKSRCADCGGWLPPHIHLDFVGHAAATDRLLQVDPEWNWEPLALADDGFPAIRRNGSMASMWIKLTICGLTRLGVGTAPSAKDELEKELISDAIRNAAMRFGVALDLWSKEDLHASESAGGEPASDTDSAGSDERTTGSPAAPASDPSPASPPAKLATPKQRQFIERLVDKCGAIPDPQKWPNTWPLPERLPAAVASGMIDWLNAQPVEPPAERVATLRKDLGAVEKEFVG